MKVKICLYSEKAIGAVLTPLVDSVYVDGVTVTDGVITGLTDGVLSVLNSGSMYLKNPAIITQVEVSGINRAFDLINLQVYLRNLGLVLLVGEVLGDKPEDTSSAEVMVSVVGMVNTAIPMITDYYSTFVGLKIKDVIADQINKYRVGDPTLIPDAEILDMIKSMEEMETNGLVIDRAYESALMERLGQYGFTIYYIRVN